MAEILTDSQLLALLELDEPKAITLFQDERMQIVASHRALAAERDKLTASRRVHELDNHHNALACGYCNGPLLDELRRLETQVRELTEERQQWLNWADGLTGNQHYLASKMRQEIAERIRTLEFACEAALKMMRFLLEHRHAFISGYRYEIEKEVEQLEGAIKHG